MWPHDIPPAPLEAFDEPAVDPLTCPITGAAFEAIVHSAAVDTKPTSSDLNPFVVLPSHAYRFCVFIQRALQQPVLS